MFKKEKFPYLNVIKNFKKLLKGNANFDNYCYKIRL